MTEIKPDEIQQELFGEFGAPASKPKSRFPSLQKAQKPILISTSIEQILLGAILLILTACLVFFLGILRGKSLPEPPVRQSEAVSRAVASSSAPDRSAATRLPLQSAQRTPASGIGKPYTIQLVTFKKVDLAEKEVAGLHGKGLYAFIIPSGDYYQVCAGQYLSKEDAGRNLKNFSGRYRDCFIRRR